MEMNADLIDVQGVLRGVMKTTGDFTKIRHKGGNEMKINNIIKELEDLLVLKGYIDKRKPKQRSYKQLDEITFFLVLNLDFACNTVSDIEEFAHLVGAIPTLSKCLLANIVVELDLNEFYCNALHRLPVECSEEILSEIVPCIKKTKSNVFLRLLRFYMSNIIKKINSVNISSGKLIEHLEKLEDISAQFLLNCGGINSDYTQNWKSIQVYEYMGKMLLCLLKLLLQCDVDNENLSKIITDLINRTCTLMNSVTVDVFCAWAEIEQKEVSLQNAIAETSYAFIEKYQKYQPASSLLRMLSNVAKKPKSLNETIQEATVATMIQKINEGTDRNKWFSGLLNTQVFQNEETKKCVKRWSHLCSVGDMDRLLSLVVQHRNEEDCIELIVQCASSFDEEALTMLITRYFHQYGLKCCLKSQNTSPQLIVTMNKLERKSNEESTKDLLLLMLQDPVSVLTELYKGCVKNNILFESLREFFKCATEILAIEKLFCRAFQETVECYPLDNSNLKNYNKLLGTLVERNYKNVLYTCIMPFIKSYLHTGKFEDVDCWFYLFEQFVNKSIEDDRKRLIKISLEILEKCRWQIFDFSNAKAAVADKTVQVLSNCSNSGISEFASVSHPLNEYYIKNLNKSEENFLGYVCPHLSTDKHAESVGYMIKLLPICTTTEWYTIMRTLLTKSSDEAVVRIITDTLIIVSQVTQTQQSNENILNGLRYCLQNYGLILKDIILSMNHEETNIFVIKSICRLLREMPKEAIAVEGMSLMSLIPDETLKQLKDDEGFVSILLSMEGSDPSRIIARRMLQLQDL